MLLPPSKTKTGYQVKLCLQVTQHSRDTLLLILISKILKCGHVTKNRNAFDYRVTRLSSIENKIIPLFKKHPIRGVKAQDFADWCIVAEMIKEKKHLTAEGLEQIKRIKAGMNTGRKF